MSWLVAGILSISISEVIAVRPASVRGNLWPLRNRESESFSKSLDFRNPSYDPGQRAPPLLLPTLSGNLDLDDLIGNPVIFSAHNPRFGFSNALWGDATSIDDFLARNPSNAHFIFLPFNSTESVESLQKLFSARLATSSELFSRLHFVNVTVEKLGADPETAWVQTMLEQYPTYLDTVEASVNSNTLEMPMLNSWYDWLGWSHTPSGVFGNATIPVAKFGNSCGGDCSADFTGQLVLVEDGLCDHYTKVKSAAACNASGVAVISSSSLLQSMNCANDAECNDLSFGLPAFMITQNDGSHLLTALAAGDSVSFQFCLQVSPGTDFGIDAFGKLRQTWGGSGLGNVADTVYGNPGDLACKLYPSLEFVAWAAQWLDFQQGVEAQAAQPAHVVSVFANVDLRPASGNCYGSEPWGCGPSAVVNVPSAAERGAMGRQYTTLEVDFALGCGDGSRDVDCPQWDHIITLLGCCGDVVAEDASCDASQGFELGRWITTFGRGVGRWLTDVSPLLPVINGDVGVARSCNLTVFSVPWAGSNGNIPWTGTLSMRFVEPPQPPALTAFKVLQPWSNVTTSAGSGVYEYFKWISFNQSYETFFEPFVFDSPSEFEKASLTVVVSGHGNDNHGCGEFCTTTHHFTVNGNVNVKDLDNSDNAELGCGDSVTFGTTPNEYGTWLYGRDGWCDGREVAPWVVDLTDQLKPTGNVVKYHGLFNGSIPDPSSLQQGSPVMMLRAYITFYEASTGTPNLI